jgi:HlyD family secretion protein
MNELAPHVRRIAGSLLSLLLLLGSGCGGGRVEPGKAAADPGHPAPAEKAEAVVETRSSWYEAVGSIRSRTATTVAAQITGRIVGIGPDAGNDVRRGDRLALIDDREALARHETARSELARAQAEAVRADAHHGRISRLFKEEAATAEQLEAAESGKKAGDAAVAAAGERVREAEVAAKHTQVLSPVNGVVVRRLVEVGDMALAGKPLYELHDPGVLRLEARVREGAIAGIAVGDTVPVYISALSLTVDGTVGEIEPRADSVSRSFNVKIDLPRHEGLFPGMYGKARLNAGRRPAIFVPRAAVRQTGQLRTLLVLQDGRWVRRYVTVGERDGDRIEILSGLSAGEVIGWNV